MGDLGEQLSFTVSNHCQGIQTVCVCVHGRHKRKLFIAISRTKIMYAQYNVSFSTLDLRLSCYGSSTHKWSGRRNHFFQDFLF